MDTDPGYDTSLLFCQVTMGFDSEKGLLSKSSCELETSETDDATTTSSSSLLSSVLKILKHSCDFPGCKAKFDRPWKLSAHRCIHTGERPYKCKKVGCSKSYTNLTHLRRHLQTTHVEKQTSAPDGTPIVPTTYLCQSPGCDLKFQSKCSMKRHYVKKHSDQKNQEGGVKCPDCDLVFTRHNQLKSHMYTHDGVKPFKCEWCNSCFLNHSDVMSHMRKHKLYKCSYSDCPDGSDKLFNSWLELKSHVSQIHPSKYSCENCDKEFSLKCRLMSHKLSCGSDNNEKPYKCIMDDCSHFFKLHRNMLQHVKHKHGEPRFACTIENCGKKFIWKISYNKHIRTYHDLSQEWQQLQQLQKPKTHSGDDDGEPKQRKKRKDANIPKVMVAEALSGVSVDKVTQLELFNKEHVNTDKVLMQQTIEIASNDSSVVDCDSAAKTSKVMSCLSTEEYNNQQKKVEEKMSSDDDNGFKRKTGELDPNQM